MAVAPVIPWLIKFMTRFRMSNLMLTPKWHHRPKLPPKPKEDPEEPPPPPPPPSSPTGFILRHFSAADLALIDGGFDFGDYDGFVAGHNSDQGRSTITTLTGLGKKFFQYFVLLNYPFSSSTDSWFNFFRSTAQSPLSGWGARYASGSKAAQFSTLCIASGSLCGGLHEFRELVAWDQIGASRWDILLDKMLAFTTYSIFFDQVWLEPPDFFWCGDPNAVSSATCAPLSCRSCLDGAVYSGIARDSFLANFPAAVTNQIGFVNRVNTRLAALFSGYALSNGRAALETEVVNGVSTPRPIFLENAAVSGTIPQFRIDRWRADPRNVLSIVIPASPTPIGGELEQLKALFQQNGGWVSLTGADSNDANMMSAFAQLSAARP